MIAYVTEAPSVTDGLLDYLRSRLAISDLEYQRSPRQIPNGRETYTFQFQVHSPEATPQDFHGPLILRLYASAHGLETLQHDFAVQDHMTRLGYPVSRPVLLETDSTLFGGPFMIMQFARGQNLLDLMFDLPWRILDVPKKMADWQTTLHTLPARAFPTQAGSFLDRKLAELDERVRRHDLLGLMPGIDWLQRHRPSEPASPSIIHLDFHPMNLMLHETRHTVLDWADSDVGDRHADVATSLVLVRTVMVEIPYAWQRLLHRAARFLLERLYLRFYRRHLPLDKKRLSYYLALASMRRLSRWGLWLRAGPHITGSKPSSMRFWNAREKLFLERCFFTQSGVPIQL